MKLHFYGKLDSLESCFTYQAFDEGGVTFFLQNAPRFGYEPATIIIKNPALFIKKNDGFYRFVVEDFEEEVKVGKIIIDKETLKQILNEALSMI